MRLGDGPKAWSPRGEHPLDPAKWFNLEALWNDVRRARQDPYFRDLLEWSRTSGEPAVWPVVDLVSGAAGIHQAGEAVKLFKIPFTDVEGYREGDAYSPEVWDDAILPFANGLADAMNRRKPEDIPGRLGFGWHEADNTFGLQYLEGPLEG